MEPICRRFGPRMLVLLPLLALTAPLPASAQTDQLGGRIRSEDGRPVEGALAELHPVSDSTLTAYTLADDLGFFAFRDLEPGAYILRVARIGFREHREEVGVGGGATEVEIVMAPQPIVAAGITVEAERSRAQTRFEESAGITVQEIGTAALKSLPIVAESDPLRAIEVLPGVTTTSDFSAAFNVRGGSADQNLILLDEVPIFNPFHLGGIFSVFNADMVDRVELQSGGFAAEYGGRVSSVLTVASDPGDGEFGADAGVSVLASRLAVNGALPRSATETLGFRTTRWRMSARRSYLDVLFRPWVDVPYHLSDLQGVFEAWTGAGAGSDSSATAAGTSWTSRGPRTRRSRSTGRGETTRSAAPGRSR